MTDNEALIAKVIAKARADASDIRHMEHESYHWVAGLIDNLADALEVKERENPSNCTCGYGGFHEPENKNCEANND